MTKKIATAFTATGKYYGKKVEIHYAGGRLTCPKYPVVEVEVKIAIEHGAPIMGTYFPPKGSLLEVIGGVQYVLAGAEFKLNGEWPEIPGEPDVIY